MLLITRHLARERRKNDQGCLNTTAFLLAIIPQQIQYSDCVPRCKNVNPERPFVVLLRDLLLSVASDLRA